MSQTDIPKLCIITGANTGIGKATASDIIRLRPDYTLIFACRSIERAEQAKKDILNEIPPEKTAQIESAKRIEIMKLDLSDLESVRDFSVRFSANYDHLDLLILNAGIVVPSKQLSKQNHENMFATNHLGHFLLTNLLLPSLRKAPNSARIVVVASDAHKFYSNFQVDQIADTPDFGISQSLSYYGRSKLCNILFTTELERRLAQEEGCDPQSISDVSINKDKIKDQPHRKITVNCLHPGAVNTELGREAPALIGWLFAPIMRLFFRTPAQGAETSVYVALSGDMEGVSGGYYDTCKRVAPTVQAQDPHLAANLWDYSLQLTQEYLEPLSK